MGRQQLKLIFPFLFILMVDNVQGYRLLNIGTWRITPEDPTIWLRLSEEDLEVVFSETSFDDGTRPLLGVSPEDHVTTIVQMIIDDYNSIEGSYLRLAFYPVDGYDFGTDPEDSTFSTELAENRTILVGSGGARTVEVGHAIPEVEGDSTVGCNINITDRIFSNAQALKEVLTHEIGHCVGLDHNHADSNSIMSYVSPRHDLGVDDKIGLVHQYPNEVTPLTNTLGLSCAVQE